jgi:hypothetical protein
MTKPKMTYDDFLQKAQELREAAFNAETALLQFLIEFENSDTWEEGGYNSFAQLLRAERLCSHERFENYKNGLMRVSRDADIIGVPATIQAGLIEDDAKRNAFVKEVKLAVKEKGFPLANEQAEAIRQMVDPHETEPARSKRQRNEEKRIEELELALQSLRDENKELRKENARLKKRLAKYEAPDAHP